MSAQKHKRNGIHATAQVKCYESIFGHYAGTNDRSWRINWSWWLTCTFKILFEQDSWPQKMTPKTFHEFDRLGPSKIDSWSTPRELVCVRFFTLLVDFDYSIARDQYLAIASMFSKFDALQAPIFVVFFSLELEPTTSKRFCIIGNNLE